MRTLPTTPGPVYSCSGCFCLSDVRNKHIPVRKSLGWPMSIQKPWEDINTSYQRLNSCKASKYIIPLLCVSWAYTRLSKEILVLDIACFIAPICFGFFVLQRNWKAYWHNTTSLITRLKSLLFPLSRLYWLLISHYFLAISWILQLRKRKILTAALQSKSTKMVIWALIKMLL